MMIKIIKYTSSFLKCCLLVVLLLGVLAFLDFHYELIKEVREASKDSSTVETEAPRKVTHEEFLGMIPSDIPQEYHLLLWETAVMESNATLSAKQVKGEALGVMQVEPQTENDIWANFLSFRPELKKRVELFERNLQHNTQYNIYIAYLCYYRNLYNKSVDLSDKWTRAWCYKKYYNTHKGKGTTKAFYHGRKL